MSPNCFIRKIVSLNIKSLPLHLEDLKEDPTLKMADIICLQETFCKKNDRAPYLPNYTVHLAGEGRGRGVAIFVKDTLNQHVREVICRHKFLLLINPLFFFMQVRKMDFDFFQGLKICFPGLQLINIYRSPNPAHRPLYQNFIQILEQQLRKCDCEETVVCGDFNFNFLTEGNRNSLTKALRRKGFKQIVNEPTNINGTCIDHIYTRLSDMCIRYKLYSPYYADHDALLMMLKKKIVSGHSIP